LPVAPLICSGGNSMGSEPQTSDRFAAVVRSGFRLALLVLLAYGIHLLINWATDLTRNGHPTAQIWMLATLLVVYAVLIAIPFVPGIEIGLSLLAMQGAWIAPLIYVSTVAGLMLAYTVGARLSSARLQRALQDLRLSRIGSFVDRLDPLTQAQRLDMLRHRVPNWQRPFVSRYRYVVLAALVNMPGNSIIGGGGGILLLAGFSRLFAPMTVGVTMAIAVLPVPLTFWVFGINLLG